MSKITKNTLSFLSALNKNNHRPWFDENRTKYEASKNEIIAFADEVIERLNKFDVITNESGKKSLFRIFRDVRFSKDKSPYKSHWSGYFRRAGNTRRGGFYFNIQPGNSYISGGFFGPNKEDLLHLRKQITTDAEPLIAVLSSQEVTSYFGQLLGEKVKTAPKGFSKEDPNIHLMRHKQFYLKHEFTDKEVLQQDFPLKVAEGFQKMIPYFEIMTSYLLTDLNGEPIG